MASGRQTGLRGRVGRNCPLCPPDGFPGLLAAPPPDTSGLLPPSWGSVHSSVCPSVHPGNPLRAWLGLVVPMWRPRARRQSRGEGTPGPEDARSRAAAPPGLGPPTPVLVCVTVALRGGGRSLPSFRPVPGEPPQPAHPVLSPENCALGSQPASQERAKGRRRSQLGISPAAEHPGSPPFPRGPCPTDVGGWGHGAPSVSLLLPGDAQLLPRALLCPS